MIGASENPYRWLLAIVVVYVGLYGAMLVYTDGLPYVMDNNESFSSLWHAANLYHFGPGQSYGLADESFSPHASAHPYVHTHQGNFPRLFAFLIYVLGARTIESQIAITTFTVGLAAIGLVWLFFARVATPVFAALVCAVFMTDYVLFAQWHVVTYRVWHCFLLFFALYCTDRATEPDGKRWLLGIGAAYWSLFYSELVFAAFAGAFCALYALYRCGNNLRRAALIILAQAGGGSLALLLVVFQAVSYLGLEDFRRDIYLTFLARNDLSRVPELMEQAARFFESRRAIFWYNFQERAPFAGVLPFLRSFTSFDWRTHTPLLAIVIWTLGAGWLLGLVRDRDGLLSRKRVVVAASAIFVFCTVFVLPIFQESLFNRAFAPIWNELRHRAGPDAVQSLVLIASGLLSFYVALVGAGKAIGNGNAPLRRVLAYILCGGLAYGIVYSLSPGYIYSGYLQRSAPFTVFLTDVVVAAGAFVAGAASLRLVRSVLASNGTAPLRAYAMSSIAGVGVLLCAFMVGYWVLIQVSYLRWMPPDHYSFLKKLSSPPYRGAAFVVNNYAAPVAAYTGQWAYFDPAISQGFFVRMDGKWHLAGDKKYLWFADRDSNPEYQKPGYFVCMIGQSPITVAYGILKEQGAGLAEPGCSQLGLVRLANDSGAQVRGITLVEYDRLGLEKRGTDFWAILKLDWDRSPDGAVLDWDVPPAQKAAGAK